MKKYTNQDIHEVNGLIQYWLNKRDEASRMVISFTQEKDAMLGRMEQKGL